MTSSPSSLFFLLLCLPSLTLVSPARALATSRRSPSSSSLSPWRRAVENARLPRAEPASGYFDPVANGGSMLTEAPGTFPPAGEPLNIIIAGTSDPAVLVDQQDNGGFRNYMLSIGFAAECLGQHEGAPQTADLGDGHGQLNETAELRWDYGNPSLGTCEETVEGGDHFRYWVQNGPSATSNAIFMATSYEMPLSQGHNIVPNGYNLGRDWLIGNITHSPIDTDSLTNTSTFSGTTSYAGFVYSSSISYVSGLLANSSIGVNHNTTVPVGGKNAVDGLVAVIEVTITTIPANATKNGAIGLRAGPRQQLPSLVLPTLLLLLLGAVCL